MKSIRSRIMSAILILVFTVIVAMSVIFMWFLHKSNVQMLRDSMNTLSQHAALNFDGIVSEYVRGFENFAESSDYSHMESDDLRVSALDSAFKDEGAMVSYAVFAPGGSLTASVGNECNDIVSEEDIQQAVQHKDVIVTNVKPSNGANYFAVLVPLSENGEVKFVSATAVSCAAIDERLKSTPAAQSSDLFVVDNEGTVRFLSSDKHVTLGSNIVELGRSNDEEKALGEAVSTALNGRSGSYDFRYKGESYTMGYRETSYFNCVLVAYTSSNNYTDQFKASSLTAIIIMVFVLMIVTAIVTNAFSKRITKPLASATERLKKLSEGDTITKVEVFDSKDELGILTSSLDETVSNLRQYISRIQEALIEIADGNLTHNMEGDFKGDFSEIKITYNEILDKLRSTFESINHSAVQVTSGAVQVANSAHSLSQGATQQASAVEELSATLSGVSDQVEQNSQSARDAYRIVDDNSRAIEDCNNDMNSLLEAMQQIRETSEEITSILKVIDEISFQTNILALNAAVEAAREGSKGFGVVADEVRRLAARTAEAARKTSTLIDKTTSTVGHGHNIAVQTAESLRGIEENSEHICLLMRNIADASEEQADAIKQINTGVDQISDVVSANSAAAVGSASASEELSGQSLILKNMISRFRLTNDGGEHYKESEQDFDFSIDLSDEEPTPAPTTAPKPTPAPTPTPAPVNPFLKTDSASDDDDDDDDDDEPAGNMGGLAMLFRKDSDDDDDDDKY